MRCCGLCLQTLLPLSPSRCLGELFRFAWELLMELPGIKPVGSSETALHMMVRNVNLLVSVVLGKEPRTFLGT